MMDFWDGHGWAMTGMGLFWLVILILLLLAGAALLRYLFSGTRNRD